MNDTKILLKEYIYSNIFFQECDLVKQISLL